MHHHRVDAQQLEQHHVGGEQARDLVLAHGVAAVFDDHDLAVVDLDIRQGFGEGLGGGPTGVFLRGAHRARQ